MSGTISGDDAVAMGSTEGAGSAGGCAAADNPHASKTATAQRGYIGVLALDNGLGTPPPAIVRCHAARKIVPTSRGRAFSVSHSTAMNTSDY
jgi:hypothetical protein